MAVSTPLSAIISGQMTGHPLLLTQVRLLGYPGLKRVWISSDGVVQAIEAIDSSGDRFPPAGLEPEDLEPEDLTVVDLNQDWLSLGGVDLQINGALGLAFPDLNPDNAHRLPEICEFLWQQGVDGFLPTLVTCSLAQVHSALQVLMDYCKRPSPPHAAQILGVHLEGPCLNPEKRGAHPQEHLQPLTVEAMSAVLGDSGDGGCASDIVKLVTLAPELDPSGAVIEFLVERGIAVSLGHSQATAAEANRAFDQGATLVTHAFNAMPSLHHRQPGLLGAALVRPGVSCGLIADGEHIAPLMLQLLLRMGLGHLFLVSDALAPLGLPDGTYPWDSREICVTQGTARLADGTLSGTTLPLLAGVSNLVQWGLSTVEEAIALATAAPRQALGDEWTAGDQSPYLGRSIQQLLRWQLDSQTQVLSWSRLVE